MCFAHNYDKKYTLREVTSHKNVLSVRLLVKVEQTSPPPINEWIGRVIRLLKDTDPCVERIARNIPNKYFCLRHQSMIS